MKWFAETTQYNDSIANGVYLLDDAKSKMYAFRPAGGAIKVFKNFIRIDVRGRKFAVNPEQWATDAREPEPEGRYWVVKGSKGDEYRVTELNSNYSCTCSGFKFRSKCRHITELA